MSADARSLAERIAHRVADASGWPEWMLVPSLGQDMTPVVERVLTAALESGLVRSTNGGDPQEIRHHCDVPAGAMVVGVYEIVSYLTEDGEREFVARRAGDDPYASTVGMLAWAQKRLLDQWDREG